MYHLLFRETEFCVVSSPAIRWRSVELNCQPSDVTCHLVAVRETPVWVCDRTDIHKVPIVVIMVKECVLCEVGNEFCI
jgi:hypothetical protein